MNTFAKIALLSCKLINFTKRLIMEKIILKVGDKAPDFKAIDQDGKEMNLSDYKSKKVILYFYPKDNTSGCSRGLQFTRWIRRLTKNGARSNRRKS